MDAFPLVTIEWMDARVAKGGWVNIGEYEPSLITCRSVGFVVSETDDLIALASTLNSAGQSMPTVVIPKAWIVSRRLLARTDLIGDIANGIS
ncbi:MAG: hypothetical protein C0506_06600 [Anaerolinea sp.]|nr:hypothetical protein [Anaerolinea sp.]